MIEINIPGGRNLQLENLVCDVNGTLAVDGQLPDGLERRPTQLQVGGVGGRHSVDGQAVACIDQEDRQAVVGAEQR